MNSGGVRVDGLEGRRGRRPPDLKGLLLAAAILVGATAVSVSGVFGSRDPESEAQSTTSTTTTIRTTTTLPTTTTLSPEALEQLEYEADVELISRLWWDQTTAWASGFDSGIQFWVENNYPDMGCSFDDYMDSWFPGGPIDGFQIERTVSKPTIRRDAGWIIPGGSLRGVEAKGRVYVMAVRDQFIAPDIDTPVSVRDFHVTILDGRAHFFVGCST